MKNEQEGKKVHQVNKTKSIGCFLSLESFGTK